MSFNVNIFTPTRAVVKNLKAKELLVPTVRGQINLLKDHTHIVTSLDTGVLLVTGEDGSEHHFLLTTGICKVQKEEVVILTQVCESADDIDSHRADKALKLAESKLSSGSYLQDGEVQKFQRKRDRAKIRLLLSMQNKK